MDFISHRYIFSTPIRIPPKHHISNAVNAKKSLASTSKKRIKKKTH